MQTFLPCPDFRVCAKYLDTKRLGKQRVEAKQILDILLNRTDKTGWRNHPAVLMWKGHENALKFYYNCMIEEWIRRGYKNNMTLEEILYPAEYPSWMIEKLFKSHRSNLLRKDHSYYSKFGWQEPTDLEYYWPVRKNIK